jgi:hypothetical protein
MPEVTLNYWAIIVSAIVSMVLGALWYSPVLFGKQWMQLMGWTKEQVKKEDANKGYLLAMIGALILAYVMSHFVDYVGATTVSQGAQTGFWTWLGFAATTSLTTSTFEGKPTKLWGINSGYNLVQFILTGAILAVWA